MFCDIVTSAAVLWTCSSLVGSRCFRPSRTVTGESAARTDTRCSAGRRCATAGPQPIGRSGRTAARHSRRTSLAPGWTRLSEPDTDRHISLVLEYFHSTCTRVNLPPPVTLTLSTAAASSTTAGPPLSSAPLASSPRSPLYSRSSRARSSGDIMIVLRRRRW